MLDQVSNKYLLNIIFSCIPEIKFLNIIKKSKKLQQKLNFSLLNYQNVFLSKKLKINYDSINIDKYIGFIFEEFQIKEDKKLLEKMIEEKKKGEAIIQINNLSVNKNQELKYLNKDITWISDKNIIKLDLSGIFRFTRAN